MPRACISTSGTFAADSAHSPATITLAAPATLGDAAAAINAANAGVTAYVTTGTNGAQLVLKSPGLAPLDARIAPVLALAAFALVLMTNAATVVWSFAALAVAGWRTWARRQAFATR